MSNRVAMVTGSAQGIGKGIAMSLAQNGFRVAVADMNLEVATQTAQEITDAGGTATAVEIDVTDSATVASAIASVEADLGPIEVLVNNAGWDDFMPFVKTDEAFWDKILDINFKGALRVTQAVLPGMFERGFGRVVNIGSDAGRVGSSLEAVYSGAKGGIIAFTKTLSRTRRRRGAGCSRSPSARRPSGPSPAPGSTPSPPGSIATSGLDTYDAKDRDFIRHDVTPGIPLQRFGSESEVSAAITFLLSPAARFITGSYVRVDGGAPNARRGWWELQPASHNKPFDGFHRSVTPDIRADLTRS